MDAILGWESETILEEDKFLQFSEVTIIILYPIAIQ